MNTSDLTRLNLSINIEETSDKGCWGLNIKCIFNDINRDGHCQVTWEMLMRDLTIKSIQEPISELYIEKEDFEEAYGEFMQTLDGRDISSYVDFFWRRSPIDRSCLEFVDRDARLDIYEYLREEKLVPDMKKVHSGEWKFKNQKNNKGKKQSKKKNKPNNDGDKS